MLLCGEDSFWVRECLSDVVLPHAEGVAAHVAVVEAAVARHFFSDEMGLFECVILAFQLYFRHDETFVLALEDIDLPGVSPVG